MASRTRNTRRTQNVAASQIEDDDEPGPSTRRSAGRGRRSTPQPEVERRDEKLPAILNYILRHIASKVPIKMSQLQQLSGGNNNEQNQRVAAVMELLKEHYGIELKQLPGPGKRLICIADSPIASAYELTKQQRPVYTLLYIILTFIFMRQNVVEDEQLFRFLNLMNIDVNETHSYFGENLKKLIEETFVKQMYLKRERQPITSFSEPKIQLSWGPRAEAEISFDDIIAFSAKLFREDPSFFDQQLNMARRLANPEAYTQRTPSETSSVDLDKDWTEQDLDLSDVEASQLENELG
ncbi:MAGE-like protein 2 [Scaptodrosophila lebanonensis]|uniref:MAGE-like protein 2 n=1 Tax=Drosophila lebanonensis TaxID=7225 RepID=A0A6J2TGM4_DROLE|nr:MAGE-like protein 2 [Scaptodrosophila lebanonensis]